MPDAKPLSPEELDEQAAYWNHPNSIHANKEMSLRWLATVRDRERERDEEIGKRRTYFNETVSLKAERDELQGQRDEYLRIIQCDLNVQIDAAEGALVAAGLEDFETLAAGIGAIAKERDELRRKRKGAA